MIGDLLFKSIYKNTSQEELTQKNSATPWQAATSDWVHSHSRKPRWCSSYSRSDFVDRQAGLNSSNYMPIAWKFLTPPPYKKQNKTCLKYTPEVKKKLRPWNCPLKFYWASKGKLKDRLPFPSHRIHVWYIYLPFTIKINQILLNIPYMDPMGIFSQVLLLLNFPGSTPLGPTSSSCQRNFTE